MSQHKPQDVYGKAAFIAPAIIGVLIILLVVIVFYDHGAPPASQTKPVTAIAKPVPVREMPVAPPAAERPAVPQPPMGRRELVEAAMAATAQFAADAKMSSTSSALVGRKFSIRIAFGCDPAQAAPDVLQSTVTPNPERKTLTLTARPAIWTDFPAIQDLPNRPEIEAVEGFWIPRPWTFSETCPAHGPDNLAAVAVPQSLQTLGLARLFGAGESRVQRRAEHPYQLSLKTTDPQSLQPGSYRLLLEGSLAAFADGNALHCWSQSPAQRPICLYSVIFTRAAFEDARTGEVLAEWDQ